MNNRVLIMLALAIMPAASWGNYLSEMRSSAEAYHAAYQNGEEAAASGLYERAADYFEACRVYQDSMELREKEFENLNALYQESSSYQLERRLESFISEMLKDYSREPRAYELAAQYYSDQEEWSKMINLLDRAENMEVVSERLAQYEESVQYRYEIDYSLYAEVGMLSENLYAAKDNAGWCYITRRGASYINGPYEFATPMYNNRACVKFQDQVYLIDGEGKKQKILPEDIECVGYMGDTWLPVRRNGQYSFFNPETDEIRGSYEFAGRYKEGMAAVRTKEGWSVVDESGNVISPQIYEDIILSSTGSCCSDGYIAAKSDGQYHFLDKEFRQAVQFACEDMDFWVESVFAFSRNGLWGFADLNGNVVMEPVYEEAKSYSNGLAAVKMNGKWGFVNEEGAVAIDCSFDDAWYFNDLGYCFVKNGEAWKMLKLLEWE